MPRKRRTSVRKQLKQLDNRLDALEDCVETKMMRFSTELDATNGLYTAYDRCIPDIGVDMYTLQQLQEGGKYPGGNPIWTDYYNMIEIKENGLFCYQPLQYRKHSTTNTNNQQITTIDTRIGNEIRVKGLRFKYTIKNPPLPSIWNTSSVDGMDYGTEFWGNPLNYVTRLPRSNNVRVMVILDKSPTHSVDNNTLAQQESLLRDVLEVQGKTHNYGGCSLISGITAPRTFSKQVSGNRYNVLYDKVHKLNNFGMGVGGNADTGVITFTKRWKKGLKVVYDSSTLAEGMSTNKVIQNNIWFVAFSEYGIIGNDPDPSNPQTTFMNLLPLLSHDISFFYEDL